MDVLGLVEHLTELCDHAHVSISLLPVSEIACEGDSVSGFFDETKKHLAIACAREDWWLTFAHEYSHVSRYLTGQPNPSDDGRIVIHDWLRGKRFKRSTVESATRAIQEDELMAERGAAALCRRFKCLPPTYVQRANAYVMSYEMTRRIRSWLVTPPGQVESIWSKMPKRFIKPSVFGIIDPEMEVLFASECMSV